MLPRPTFDELQDLVQRGGLTFAPHEEHAALDLAEHLLGMVDTVDAARLPTDAPAVEPEPERPDPLNAIARWVDVPHTAPGDLDGLRLSVKDSVSLAGVELRAGSRALRGFRPQRSATVVERVLAAGADVVAVTTMDDLAYSGGGDTSIDGVALNPFDRSRCAGGSSSGAASSLWYDDIDAALGTDQGGSIRLPAAWCGVLGLKPTFGLVPYTGIVGMDPTVDHVGPLARDVDVLARVLAAIQGPDEQDPRTQATERTATTARAVDRNGLSSWRVGVVRGTWGPDSPADPAVSAAFAETLDALRNAGVTVVDVDLPEHHECGGIAFATYMEATASMHASGGSAQHRRHGSWPELSTALGEGTRRDDAALSLHYRIQVALGHHLQDTRHGWLYARAQQMRDDVSAAYDAALGLVDLLLMPTSPALPHLAAVPNDPAEHVRRGWDNLANTTPTNLTGHPAISLPLGLAGHLPVGTMAISPHHTDARLLAFAAHCEREIGWTGPPSH